MCQHSHSSSRLLVWGPSGEGGAMALDVPSATSILPRPPAGNPPTEPSWGALKAPPPPGALLSSPVWSALGGGVQASTLSVSSARPQGGQGTGWPWREGAGTRVEIEGDRVDPGPGSVGPSGRPPCSRLPWVPPEFPSLAGQSDGGGADTRAGSGGRAGPALALGTLLLTPGPWPSWGSCGSGGGGGLQPSPSLSPQGQGHPPTAQQRVRAQAGREGPPGATEQLKGRSEGQPSSSAPF